MQRDVKSATTAGLLGIFLGAFGAHNWYLGEKNKGIAHVCMMSGGILLEILVAAILPNVVSFVMLVQMAWLFTILTAVAGISMFASGIWGLIEGIIILSQGDAGLARKGYAVAEPMSNYGYGGQPMGGYNQQMGYGQPGQPMNNGMGMNNMGNMNGMNNMNMGGNMNNMNNMNGMDNMNMGGGMNNMGNNTNNFMNGTNNNMNSGNGMDNGGITVNNEGNTMNNGGMNNKDENTGTEANNSNSGDNNGQ